MLAESWQRCFDDLGAAPPAGAFDALCARYSEPHRAYHTLEHLDECFARFAQARHLTRYAGAVAFALFYHDAIYDTHAPDNEEASAALAAEVLAGCGLSCAAPGVSALILATKHDAVPQDGDAQVLVDIDLAILGAAPARFDAYELQVRREYDWVTPQAFREGRGRVLRQFLARTAIYNTDFFHQRLEGPARDNLARSLRALDSATAQTA